MESSNHNVPRKGNPIANGNKPVNLIGAYVLDFIRHQENYTTKIENIIEALARDVELDYDTVSGFVYEAIEDGISLCILSCDEDGCVIANIDFPETQEFSKATRNKEPKTDLVPLQDPPKLKGILKNATNYMPKANPDFPKTPEFPKATRSKEPKTGLVQLQDPPILKSILKNATNYMPKTNSNLILRENSDEEKVEHDASTGPQKNKECLKRHIKSSKVISKENFRVQKNYPPKMSWKTKIELDVLAELGVGEVREENSNMKAKKSNKLGKQLCDDKRRKRRKDTIKPLA